MRWWLGLLVLVCGCTSTPTSSCLGDIYDAPSADRGQPRHVLELAQAGWSPAVAPQGLGASVVGVGCGAIVDIAPDGATTHLSLDFPGNLEVVTPAPDGGSYGLPDDTGPLIAFDADGHVRWQMPLDVDTSVTLTAPSVIYATHDSVYVLALGSLLGFAATDGSSLGLTAPISIADVAATSDALYVATATQLVQIVSGTITWSVDLPATAENLTITSLAPLSDGGVAAIGPASGTFDIDGVTISAFAGGWAAEWGSDGTLAWAVGGDLMPPSGSLAAIGDQLVAVGGLDNNVELDEDSQGFPLTVTEKTGSVLVDASIDPLEGDVSIRALVPAGDGSLWADIVTANDTPDGGPTSFRFGSKTWTDDSYNTPEYLVNFVP